jgi:hypothetical protein
MTPMGQLGFCWLWKIVGFLGAYMKVTTTRANRFLTHCFPLIRDFMCHQSHL